VQDRQSVEVGPVQVKQEELQFVQRAVGDYAGYYPGLQILVHEEVVVW